MGRKHTSALAGVAGLALALALPIATGGSAAMASTSVNLGSGHMWNLTDAGSKCFAASGNAHNAPVIMWSCTSEGGQQWYEGPPNSAVVGSGSAFTLHDGNGDCLGVLDASTARGAEVGAFTCDNNSDQDWEASNSILHPWPYLNLLNVGAGGECLSIADGSSANGARAIIWTCQDTPDQAWWGAPFES